MILTEDLQPISPQEVKDKGLFGPVYHGSTSDKLEKIATQGFKVSIGQERSGDVSNGFEMSNYWGGIPAPIHFLGFGIYFTTVKSIAKQFSYGNPQIGPYFLNAPIVEKINFGSQRTIMKWWLENGYNYQKTPETTYGNYQTNLESIRKERMKATIHFTDYLKSRYDAVWFKGQGIRRLLDGDQVCVYDTSKIYKVNKDLAKPGDIGSKIIAKVGIDPWGKGVEIPIGTKGIIVDKKKPDERQIWAKGSEWIYSIKWEKGGTTWGIIDSWIEPYIRKPKLTKEEESKIYRRNFWKIYEDVYRMNEVRDGEYHEITKMEEQRVIDYIKKTWKSDIISKTLKKIRHDKKTSHPDGDYYDQIDYIADEGSGKSILFQIRKNNWGVSYRSIDGETKKLITSFERIIPSSQPLNEVIGKRYSRMTKQEEQQALQHIISKMRSNGREGTEFKKIASRNKTPSYDITNTLGWRNLFADERDYSYIAYDGTDTILTIRKRADGISYRIKSVEDFKKFPTYPGNFYPLYKDKEPEILRESDSDHGESLRQTGYWGRAGAGAIILSKRTGRLLLPYRSGAVEQPHTWGVWGGAIDSNEDPSQAVRRELSEEVGVPLQIDELLPLFIYEDQRVGFRYNNFLVVVPEEFTPRLNWETEKARWFSFGDWPTPLHFGLKLLLENSKDKIFQEIRKYAPETPAQKPKVPMDKTKYNAAMHIIMLTWRDMANAGDRSNRFDYENHFVHWMLNTQQIQDLLEKYGQQFYPGAHEPGSEFQDDVENVLEMLESKFNQRRAKKINSADPLFLLKQMVRGKSWNGAKQALRKSSWASQGWTNESMPDDMAESIFNRLYRHALGETFFDKDTIRNSKRLNQLILTSDTSVDERLFIQHYNGMKRDRFPDVVKVWRGLHSPSAKIKPGDFVTFDRGCARGYTTGKYGSVISDIIPSRDLFVIKPDTGSSELLYWPEGHQIKKIENVPSFKEFYNQWAFP